MSIRDGNTGAGDAKAWRRHMRASPHDLLRGALEGDVHFFHHRRSSKWLSPTVSGKINSKINLLDRELRNTMLLWMRSPA